MAELPDDVVTFLFTDIEGSIRLWEEAPRSDDERTRPARPGNRLTQRGLGKAEGRGWQQTHRFLAQLSTPCRLPPTCNAVEIVACVLADPVSAQRMPTQEEEIGEEGARFLGELEAEMTPEAYEAFYTWGQAKSLEVTAKELLGGD